MNWLRRMMYGRHGVDQLSIALFIAYIVLSIPISFTRRAVFGILSWHTLLWLIAVIPLVLCVLRVFSTNTAKRYQENQRFLQFWNRVKQWWGGIALWGRKQSERAKDRATHKYYKCPQCSKTLRVPKGRGKIIITCPVCKTEFTKKT